MIAVACVAFAARSSHGQTTAGAASPPPIVQAAPAQAPAFEVSTVRLSGSEQENSTMMFTRDGISIHNIPLQMILREAFATEDDRITGEVGWVKSQKFDIEAKVPADDVAQLKAISFDQRRAMLIPLLQDRFGLKFHHETRDLPIYALVVAKSGVKMQPSKEDGPPERASHNLMSTGRGQIESHGTGMKALTHVLSNQLGRSVADRTGLTGNYDYTLQWTPDDAAPSMAGSAEGDPSANGNHPAADASGPSLFTALQDQLGLKLESTKGPADVIVIDHIDQPSPN
jgi:uncharacterized protein (TIGR03435 family)